MVCAAFQRHGLLDTDGVCGAMLGFMKMPLIPDRLAAQDASARGRRALPDAVTVRAVAVTGSVTGTGGGDEQCRHLGNLRCL